MALVKRLLREAGARPRRKLGQSFLVDPRGLALFAGATREAGARSWLEVGSGPGLLTCALSSTVPILLSVEIDNAMAGSASRLCRKAPNTLVVVGDGLSWTRAWRGEALVSNTPYNLTGRLIAAAARNNNVKIAVLGMQKELAHRVLAEPGAPEYGRLTVITRLFFEARLVGFLSRYWFYPRPRVDGAVVLLRRMREWSPELEEFEGFTACLFSQRNKLAARVVERCVGRAHPGLQRKMRVRDMPPELILEVYLQWRSRRAGSG